MDPVIYSGARAMPRILGDVTACLEYERTAVSPSQPVHQYDPASEYWEASYLQQVLYDLAVDMELVFFPSCYRNFARPSVAATLHLNKETSRLI